MFTLDGNALPLDTPFEHDGIQYPANWLRLSTAEEKTAIGIEEAPDPAPYDQRFYWGHANPKDHAQLVEQWAQQTRATAGTLLSSTDWMVIREADNGTAVSTAVKTWRQDVRDSASAKVEAIEATADTDELAAYVTGEVYSAWPIA